jgi:N6-adenosine-specific RNA methylase IME4
MQQLEIDNEFKSLIAPLAHDEYSQLEASIVTEGCRDALVTWRGILVDGHHRYNICTEHDIHYDTTEIDLPDRNAVKLWMLANQLGRRNLTDEQRTYYIGARYELEKNLHGGDRKSSHHFDDLKTKDKIADDLSIGSATVERAAKYKQSVDTIEQLTSSEVKDELLSGKSSLSKKDTMMIASIANGNGGKKQEQNPERAIAILDEVLAGNAKTAKQAAIYVDRVNRQHEAQQLPDTIFNVIYADPPWQYSNTGLEGSAESHYPTMPLNDICSLLETKNAQIAKNSVLFLWVTNPLLEDGLRVIKSWGFNYKVGIIWEKPYKNHGKSGWYLQTHHEYLLIATRGKCLPHWQPQSIAAINKSEHSAKPDIFREIIERMYPDYNYLELFARNQSPRKGWVFWGNEA